MSALNALRVPPTGLAGSEQALLEARNAGTRNLTAGAAEAARELVQGREFARGQLDAGQQQALNLINQQTQAGVNQLNPFAQAGQGATGLAAALLGASGPEAQSQALANFQQSPGQQFLQEQEERAILRNAAATGGLRGGNVLDELGRRAQGRAQLSFNDRIAQLQGLSGQGLQAAGQIGQLRGQQAGQGSGIIGAATAQRARDLTDTASQLAGLRTGRAAGLTNLSSNIGSQIAGGRQQAGSALANAIAQGSQSLANLSQQQGAGLSGIVGGGAGSLANILQNAGLTQAGSQEQLAALLGNIATGQGTQAGQLPSIPGVQQNQTLGQVGQLATAIALLSDERLKENIQPIGAIGPYNLYSWEWIDPDITEPTVGVIAQELQQIHPDAVFEGDDGYLRVNIGNLGRL